MPSLSKIVESIKMKSRSKEQVAPKTTAAQAPASVQAQARGSPGSLELQVDPMNHGEMARQHTIQALVAREEESNLDKAVTAAHKGMIEDYHAFLRSGEPMKPRGVEVQNPNGEGR